MKLNKPSYGVFMVDIFASSVGIFILVSLLYIIESAKATSNEAMVEKFKTLIKRDLVPVDRYSLPVSNDPLHDWGVRARHAREKQEALILLLRDKVLLYHTNQQLNTQQIVDSDIILNYYKKYNKNRRLFIEIHYHDAYHTLKAKIDEALPENVHQWVHWAYNAGNINNPNPVSQQAARPNLDMTPNGSQNSSIDPDSLGMPSSLSSNAAADGTGTLASDMQGDSDNSGLGTQSSEQNGQGQSTSEQGSNNGQVGIDEAGGQESGQPMSGSDQQQGHNATQQQAIQQALSQMQTTQDFIEQFMQDAQQDTQTNAHQEQQPQQPGYGSENNNSTANHNANQRGSGNNTQGNNNSHSSSASPENTPDNQQSDNQSHSSNATQGEQQSGQTSPKQIAKDNELAMELPENEQQDALEHIRKNVFLKVPLYSPINNFNVDIKVPGFTEQNIHLDAVKFKLHQKATTNGRSIVIGLQHGDALAPVNNSNQLDLINPVDNRGWLPVKVIKVSGQGAPQQGWIYGIIDGQHILLPLLENTVQADANNDYWYERNNKPLKAFETIESQGGTR